MRGVTSLRTPEMASWAATREALSLSALHLHLHSRAMVSNETLGVMSIIAALAAPPRRVTRLFETERARAELNEAEGAAKASAEAAQIAKARIDLRATTSQMEALAFSVGERAKWLGLAYVGDDFLQSPSSTRDAKNRSF